MAITIASTPAGIILNAMDTRIEGGNLILKTAGDAEVATLVLKATNAFASISGNVATYDDMTADSDATGGVVTKFEIQQSDTTLEYSGTVTATGGGGDLTMAIVTVGAATEVDMSSVDPITFTLP